MKHSYYYLASSLVDLVWGEQAEDTSLRDLLEFCSGQLYPEDRVKLKYLFLMSDIKNAVSHREPDDPYEEPAFYKKDEFDELLHEPDQFLPFLAEYFEAAGSPERKYPQLMEIDELTTIFYQHLDELDNQFLEEYYKNELELRNISTAVSHRHNNLTFENKLIPWGTAYERLLSDSSTDFGLSEDFPYMSRLLEVYGGTDLAVQEEVLAEIRWQQIDELSERDPFSLEYILGYVLKLKAAERWSSLNPEKGEELFNEILRTVQRSVRFELEFSKVGEDKR